MAKISVVEELVSLTGVEPVEEESEQDFLNRVMEAVNALDPDNWDQLSTNAQEWFNKCASAITSASPGEVVELPLIPGMPGTETKKKVAKEKKEKVTKTTKQKTEKGAKSSNGHVPAAHVVREILCEDMSLTLNDVLEELEKRGTQMKKSSAQVIYLGTVAAFNAALKAGKVQRAGVTVLVPAS